MSESYSKMSESWELWTKSQVVFLCPIVCDSNLVEKRNAAMPPNMDTHGHEEEDHAHDVSEGECCSHWTTLPPPAKNPKNVKSAYP